jgi:hypothetical protein
MSLRRLALMSAVMVAAGLSSSGAARAGNPFKSVGSGLAAGVVEKIPMLAATLAEVNSGLTRNEDHIGDILDGVVDKTVTNVNDKAKARLDQVDQILESRLLQVKVEANDVADHALGRVDTMAKGLESSLVKDLDDSAKKALDQADTILSKQVAALGDAVQSALGKADQVLAARIAQVDEVASRQLGNVDVIASKQRIALEQTAVRLAVLIGLIVFVVFVLRRLWGAYQELTDGEPDGDERELARAADGQGTPPSPGAWNQRGPARTWMFAKGLGGPLLAHLAAAGLAVGVLYVLYDRLPFGAQKESSALAQVHETQMRQSLLQLDFQQVRFHASQLAYLVPENGATYRAISAKADLLRDLFARPTLLATDAGINQLNEQVKGVRRLLGRTPDADLLVVDAMLLWQTGGSRADEYRAASACARALRLEPRGFAMAPLARAYLETFLSAPYLDTDAGLGRDAATLQEMRELLEVAGPDESNNPLAISLLVARRMRAVDAASSDAYVAMAQKHAALVELARVKGAAGAIAKLRAQRNAEADKVVAAWISFDSQLADTPGLAGNPAVLAIFRLDDALYTRAKWFSDNPGTDKLAPLLAPEPPSASKAAASAGKSKASPKTANGSLPPEARLKLAPPRVAWARRYRALIAGPARQLLELQEADRFAAYERAAQAFESALIAAAQAGGSPQPAALAAAALGLYVDPTPAGDRIPFARALVPAGTGQMVAGQAVAGQKTGGQTVGDQGGAAQLSEALRARGVRLL